MCSKFSLSSTLLSTCAFLLLMTIYSDVRSKEFANTESHLDVYPFSLKNLADLVGFFAIQLSKLEPFLVYEQFIPLLF